MKKLILMTIFTIFAITGCGSGEEDKDAKKFWAQDMKTGNFYQVKAEKLAENSKCIIWAEKGSDVTEATANSIANEYANNIYPKMMNFFGDDFDDSKLGKVNTMQLAHWIPTGKTNDAKLTILLLDIKDGYKTRGDSYVGGYFYPVDLYKNKPNDSTYKYSNELDMIYLDTYPSVLGSNSSYETLAHEMQHLMNFVYTYLFRDNIMDTWIDEGLSVSAERVYSGTHPEQRWKYYNNDAQSGLIKEGNNFFVWGNHADKKGANIDDYTTAYLFFQWLRLQSNDDPNIYYYIISSDFSDYRAVTSVAKEIIDDNYYNWSLLLRDWFAANFTNASGGRYGYRGDSVLKDIKAPMVPKGTTSLYLFPGEGVYSRTETSGKLPDASDEIKYAGLRPRSVDGSPSNTNFFSNGAQLTYNVDTETDKDKAASKPGSTTGIAPSADISISTGGASRQIASHEFSESYKVDASYFLRRNMNNGIYIDRNNIPKVDRSTVRRVFVDE